MIFFQNFEQGASYKFLLFPARILMLERNFLDFWNDKFIVHILCFISLLILCLEVDLTKRLLNQRYEFSKNCAIVKYFGTHIKNCTID